MDLASRCNDRNQESRRGIMKNKDKYDLTKLTFKIEGENNPSQVFKILDGTNVVFEKPILLNRADLSLFLSWLEEEYKPTILTEKEKATPKKPKNWKAERRPNGKVEFNCPVCNRLYTERVNFCASCGQAIDWSEK